MINSVCLTQLKALLRSKNTEHVNLLLLKVDISLSQMVAKYKMFENHTYYELNTY